MRLFARREGAVATPNPEVLRQRLEALAGVDLRLPNYHEFSVLARGGSSVVFLARERRIDRPVAIKVLPPDKELHAAKQFEREKEIAVSLGRHPYIVQVFDAGAASDGSPFLVMEYFERGSLADRLRNEGPLSVDENLSIIEKIGSALQAAHDAGILHRDVKPSNILFSEYGPSLSDFGISRSVSRGEWTQSLAHFTPWHSAPEILEGDNPSIASDVYSLASTMFTTLDGRPPFVVSGDDRSLAYQLRVLKDPLPTLLRRDLPAGLQNVLVKAMAKLPADRFDSVTDFLAALRALSTVSSATPTVGGQAKTPQADRVKPPVAALPDGDSAPTLQTSSVANPVSNPVVEPVDAPDVHDSQAGGLGGSPTTAPTSNAVGQTSSLEQAVHLTDWQGESGAPVEPDDEDAMFRPPSKPEPTKLVSTRDVEAVEFAPLVGGVDAKRVEPIGHAVRAAESVEGSYGAPPVVGAPEAIRSAAPVHEPRAESRAESRNEPRNAAVRAVLPLEQLSPAEEEATVLGQRRVVAPVLPVPNKRQVPLAWIALLVTALIGGLVIAFYPGERPSNSVAQPPTETTVGQAGAGSTIVPASTPSPSTPPVDPLPRVSASSPQQVTVLEKLEDSGEFSLAEIRWTDGTPPLVAAYVAASKQGDVPRAVPIEDATSKRAVIVGIDPKAAYCFWVVAFDTAVRPIVQYRSEQQCVRGGVPYSFQ